MTFNSQSSVVVEPSTRMFLPRLQVFHWRIVHRAGACLPWKTATSSYLACWPSVNWPESHFPWDVKCEKEKGLAGWDKFQGSKCVSTHLQILNTEKVKTNTKHTERWARHLSSMSARTNCFINTSYRLAFVSLQVRGEIQPEWREIRTFPLMRMGPKLRKLMII